MSESQSIHEIQLWKIEDAELREQERRRRIIENDKSKQIKDAIGLESCREAESDERAFVRKMKSKLLRKERDAFYFDSFLKNFPHLFKKDDLVHPLAFKT